MSSLVAGIDGCEAGWFAVFASTNGTDVSWKSAKSFRDVIESTPRAHILAVDIPIGLLDAAQKGGRACDQQARKLLGSPRCSSVFSPPVRLALRCKTYPAALKANRDSSPAAVGISKQCYELFKKIAEVDSHVSGGANNLIYEVHPELCFYRMNSCRAMKFGKKAKGRAGQEERIQLLRETIFSSTIDRILQENLAGVGTDDKLDAMAACWTAMRIANGTAESIGDEHARIWF